MTNQFSDIGRQNRLNKAVEGILKTLKTANSGTVYAAAVEDLRQTIADYDDSERTDGKGLSQHDFNYRFWGGKA